LVPLGYGPGDFNYLQLSLVVTAAKQDEYQKEQHFAKSVLVFSFLIRFSVRYKIKITDYDLAVQATCGQPVLDVTHSKRWLVGTFRLHPALV